MRLGSRPSLAVVAALVVAGTSATPSLGGVDDDGGFGTVAFQLTLEGAVEPVDSFAMTRDALAPDDIQILCSGHLEAYPVCEATTYESSVTLPVGTVVQYSVLRWTTGDITTGGQVYLRGSVTVTSAAQVISLGYVYDHAGLPDTAVPAPSD